MLAKTGVVEDRLVGVGGVWVAENERWGGGVQWCKKKVGLCPSIKLHQNPFQTEAMSTRLLFLV